MKRKTIFLLILIVILINVCTKVFAGDLYNIYDSAANFIQSGSSNSVGINQQKVQDVSNSVYNILLVIGICVAVIISSILGIKFMIGSVEEKSQVKELLIPFIIGCAVVFGAFAIWKIVVVIGNYIIA